MKAGVDLGALRMSTLRHGIEDNGELSLYPCLCQGVTLGSVEEKEGATEMDSFSSKFCSLIFPWCC